jgi:hypothetical protein
MRDVFLKKNSRRLRWRGMVYPAKFNALCVSNPLLVWIVLKRVFFSKIFLFLHLLFLIYFWIRLGLFFKKNISHPDPHVSVPVPSIRKHNIGTVSTPIPYMFKCAKTAPVLPDPYPGDPENQVMLFPLSFLVSPGSGSGCAVVTLAPVEAIRRFFYNAFSVSRLVCCEPEKNKYILEHYGPLLPPPLSFRALPFSALSILLNHVQTECVFILYYSNETGLLYTIWIGKDTDT